MQWSGTHWDIGHAGYVMDDPLNLSLRVHLYMAWRDTVYVHCSIFIT
jgi:hypothetical protein